MPNENATKAQRIGCQFPGKTSEAFRHAKAGRSIFDEIGHHSNARLDSARSTVDLIFSTWNADFQLIQSDWLVGVD